jgi:SAM-dependent methyltransferase
LTAPAATHVRQDGTAPGPSGVFDDGNAAHLAASDTSHWWFRGKAALVDAVLARWAPSGGWLVDVGAGSAGVTSMLHWRGGRRLAIEGSAPLVNEARRRHLDAVRADVLVLPIADRCAAVVCLLDVIEHLPDPVAGLAEARRIVTADGVVVVSVPAHQWLWSTADEELGHHRRYSRQLLRQQLHEAGLEPLWCTHAFSWCVPPVWLVRKARRTSAPELGIEQASPIVDRTADILNMTERAALRRVPLPIGTSVIAVACRRPAGW